MYYARMYYLSNKSGITKKEVVLLGRSRDEVAFVLSRSCLICALAQSRMACFRPLCHQNALFHDRTIHVGRVGTFIAIDHGDRQDGLNHGCLRHVAADGQAMSATPDSSWQLAR